MDLELVKTENRYNKQQDRLEKDFGWAATTGPMAISQSYIETLANEIPNYLKANNRNEEPFIDRIRELPNRTIALSLLTTALNIIGSTRRKLTNSLVTFGRDLEGECFALGLQKFDSELASRLDRLARSRHGNLRYRKQTVRSVAKKAKYRVEKWDAKQLTIAGNWAMNVVISVLPQVFSIVVINGHGEKELALTEGAFAIAERAIKEAIQANPVYLPSLKEPKPWTDWNEGGPVDIRLKHRATILRSRHSETAAYVRAAITDGTMQPALDALNTIQGVGWRINKRVLEVIKWCHTNCISVSSLPRARDLDLPKKKGDWDNMSPEERKAWRIRANQVKLRNRGFTAERVLLAEDLATADFLSSTEGAWFTPCNFDWRGRVYPLCHFNYQREDRVRSLFEFHAGVPMTEEGLYWLKVHVANTGDFDKISKKPFDERVMWVDNHLPTITHCANYPELEEFWHKADKPFQFLAACFELIEAIKNPKHVTHLPISFDGSCSGLQHLSAMTKAAEGALVNLTHSDTPMDVYSIVAERVLFNLEQLLKNPTASQTEKNLATVCLEYGITRSLVKRNVMTYGYSSQRFGMASQLVEDLMQPLALEVLAGERPFHPFGQDNGFTASRFLAGQIFSAIEEVVKKPAEAMDCLRKLAKAMAHENKPVTWITPVGVPWINRYHESNVERVMLWLNDKGVTVRHSVGVATGFQKDINKVKAANGIAPNFVHALDASHLMMTVNALKEEGITNVALVHDSFGVHSPNAVKLGHTLRREFVRLYEDFDPLNDILAENKHNMTNPSRLPRPVAKGPMDIKEVLNAKYAFA